MFQTYATLAQQLFTLQVQVLVQCFLRTLCLNSFVDTVPSQVEHGDGRVAAKHVGQSLGICSC